jgi:uncharacterized protein YdeI (YjbR/CyaY-like superfamily)
MPKTDPKIDAYIIKAQPFARPVLEHFRELVHKACPDVEEKMKWSFPHFDYKGEMMCSMAAFKNHCSMGFWKASIMKDKDKIFGDMTERDGMGHFGKITSLADLPSDKILSQYIKEAMKLNDEGCKVVKSKPVKNEDIEVPAYFMDALNKNKKALATFTAFSASNKKEYVVWVTEAKTEDTRNKRMETTLEWMADGKIRNWKYVR